MRSDNNPCDTDSRWYAVWTRSRQDKLVAATLETHGVEHYLPLMAEVRNWSDRKQTVNVPLFSGYLFVRVSPYGESRLQVLKSPGVVGFVGNQSGPLPIPDQQIEDIRIVLAAKSKCSVMPLLNEGDRVRVMRGPLLGIEGRLAPGNSPSRLVISIEMIRQSLAVSVSRGDVELIDSSPVSAPDSATVTANF